MSAEARMSREGLRCAPRGRDGLIDRERERFNAAYGRRKAMLKCDSHCVNAEQRVLVGQANYRREPSSCAS